jgi:hypothetical protein
VALFAQHAEALQMLAMDPDLPAKAHSMYTFLKDRHDDHRC